MISQLSLRQKPLPISISVSKNKETSKFHSRNNHKGQYDLAALVTTNPALANFLVQRHGKQTIAFSDPTAVKELNKAILIKDYNLTEWDIPSPSIFIISQTY